MNLCTLPHPGPVLLPFNHSVRILVVLPTVGLICSSSFDPERNRARARLLETRERADHCVARVACHRVFRQYFHEFPLPINIQSQTFITFIIDIAVFAQVHHLIAQVEPEFPPGFHISIVLSSGPHAAHFHSPSLNFPAAVWLTFISVILTLLGGGTVYLGHRKDRAASGDLAAKSGFFGRFV
jgi:hypothetical protein